MLVETLLPSHEMMMLERILEDYHRTGNVAQVTVPFFHMLYKEIKGKLSKTLPVAEVMAARYIMVIIKIILKV